MKKNIAYILAKRLSLENSTTKAQKIRLGQIIEELTNELTINEALQSLSPQDHEILMKMLNDNKTSQDIESFILEKCPGIENRVEERLRKILQKT